jgi:hypothetical protein
MRFVAGIRLISSKADLQGWDRNAFTVYASFFCFVKAFQEKLDSSLLIGYLEVFVSAVSVVLPVVSAISNSLCH